MCYAPVRNAHCEGEARQVKVFVFPMSQNQMKCFMCENKVQKLKIASLIHQQMSMDLPLAHLDTRHDNGQ